LEIPNSLKFHNQEWITHHALEFVNTNKDAPFFLYVAPTLPHSPSFIASINSDPRITPRGILGFVPDVQPPRASIASRLENAGIGIGSSDATGLLWLDDGVGAIITELERLGIADSTVVIFASDHQNRGKFTCYEGCHVPCFIKWPNGIAANTEIEALVANIDLAPTILELCGVVPSPQMELDGVSIKDLASGSSLPVRETLLLEMGYSRAVVTGDRWKYLAIRYPEQIQDQINEENREDFDIAGYKREPLYNAREHFPNYYDFDQLYDLQNDPDEQVNLANDVAYSSKVAELRQALRGHLGTLDHSFGEFAAERGTLLDAIYNVDAPLTIPPQGIVEVLVEYSVPQSRDILLSLKAPDGTWWGGRTIVRDLPPGNGTVLIDFKIRNDPPPNKDLMWSVLILPLGQDWPQAVAREYIQPVVVDVG